MRIVEDDEFRSAAFGKLWEEARASGGIRDLGQTHQWNCSWWARYGGREGNGARLLVVVDDVDGKMQGLWPVCVLRRLGVRIASWIPL